jgi:hypothetical protein
MLLTAYLPHLAHRNWAIIRNEFIDYDEDGNLYVKDLKGADKIDPCSYRVSDGPIRAFVAAAAAEFGDEKIEETVSSNSTTNISPSKLLPPAAFIIKVFRPAYRSLRSWHAC